MTPTTPSLPTLRTAAYTAARLLSDSPARQRIVLLDAAIAAADSTARALRDRDLEAAQIHAARARGIILELAVTLRPGAMPALAESLNGLATYLHRLMLQAVSERSPDRAEGVARLLSSERDAWADRLRQSDEAPPSTLRDRAVA